MGDGRASWVVPVAVAALFPLAMMMLLVIVVIGSSGTGAASLNASVVPAAYLPWVLKAGALCPAQISAPLIAAQIEAESGWNPKAKSGAGAQGIAQFMPATWRTWGKDDDQNGKVSPYDPGDAIMAQGRFMCSLAVFAQQGITRGTLQGSVTDLALAAYNAGPSAVDRSGGIPPFAETRDYIAEINKLIPKYTSIGTLAAGPFGQRVVAAARSQFGKAYQWGDGGYSGPTNNRFDCSGLTMYAIYQASGGKIRLPHNAGAQLPYGKVVSRAEAAPGDLVFFHTPGDPQGPDRYHHVGIYSGGGKMIHAPNSRELVHEEKFFGNPGWEKDNIVFARYGT